MAKIKLANDPVLKVRALTKKVRQCRNLVKDCNGGLEAGLTSKSNTGSDTLKTWSPQENTSTPGSVVDGSTLNAPSSTVFSFNPNTTSMFAQDMPAPKINHVYYGGCLFRSEAGFTAGDGRFEWYYNDSVNGHLVFSNRVSSTNGQWVLYSAAVSLTSLASKTGWRIRNFIVNGTTASYSCKHIIIDLTETFGVGNEPTKEWCDKAVREWRTFDGYDVGSDTVTTENLGSYFSFSNGGTMTCYNFGELDSPIDPMEPSFFRDIPGGMVTEAFVTKSAGPDLATGHYTYVTFTDYVRNSQDLEMQRILSHDVYCPEAEPLLGQVQLNDPNLYSFGPCGNHSKISFYNNNRGFTQSNTPIRMDMNLGTELHPAHWRFYNFYWMDLTDSSSIFSRYQSKYGGTALTPTTVSKSWLDYWFNGKSIPLIHIGDPRTVVGYDESYNFVCNDLEIHPEIDGVYIDDSGVVMCQSVSLSGGRVILESPPEKVPVTDPSLEGPYPWLELEDISYQSDAYSGGPHLVTGKVLSLKNWKYYQNNPEYKGVLLGTLTDDKSWSPTAGEEPVSINYPDSTPPETTDVLIKKGIFCFMSTIESIPGDTIGDLPDLESPIAFVPFFGAMYLASLDESYDYKLQIYDGTGSLIYESSVFTVNSFDLTPV